MSPSISFADLLAILLFHSSVNYYIKSNVNTDKVPCPSSINIVNENAKNIIESPVNTGTLFRNNTKPYSSLSFPLSPLASLF